MSAWDDARRREARYMPVFARGFDDAVAALIEEWIARSPNVNTPNDLIELFDSLEWKAFDEQIVTAWRDASVGLMTEAGTAELAALGIASSFTVDNPFSEAYLRTRSATMITAVSNNTKEAVRLEMLRGFREGVDVKRQARNLRDALGLTPRLARAVENRRATLLAQGIAPSKVDKQVARYHKKLLKYRSERVTRTEMINSHAEGILNSWQVAKAEGYLGADTKKQWIAAAGSARTCKICRPPTGLHGQTVALDGRFTSSAVGAIARPPAHVSCRCTMRLVDIDNT